MIILPNSLSYRMPIMRSACAGFLLLTLLAMPPVRRTMEVDMAWHMFAQFPALALAGMLLAAGMPRRWRARLDAWNMLGMSGLVFAALVLALAMIPRSLDLVLVEPWLDALKFALLLLCGGALELSWRRAGLIVQGFFLGNVLPMMGVAGVLYMDTPLRLCNAYRLDEQQHVGMVLVALAWVVAITWLAIAGWVMYRKEAMVRCGQA